MKGFEACMEKQKKKARAAWSGSGDAGTEKLWFDLLDKFGPTEFLGYEVESAEGQVLAIVKHFPPNPPAGGVEARSARGEVTRVEKLEKGEHGIVITNQTPFYGESGGQVGDQGELSTAEGFQAMVTDTKKQLGQLILHYVKCDKERY